MGCIEGRTRAALPVVYPVIFTQAPRAEPIDAQDWYKAEAAGLGWRFREAIDTLTERMSANPRQFPIVFKNVRRALLRRFPYSLFLSLKTKPCLSLRVSMPAAIRRSGKNAPDFSAASRFTRGLFRPFEFPFTGARPTRSIVV